MSDKEMQPHENSELGPAVSAKRSGHGRQPSRSSTKIACEPCKKRKKKCDGRSPYCSQCARTPSACVFLTAQNPRGPPPGYIVALEKRMAETEAALQAAVSALVVNHIADDVDLYGDDAMRLQRARERLLNTHAVMVDLDRNIDGSGGRLEKFLLTDKRDRMRQWDERPIRSMKEVVDWWLQEESVSINLTQEGGSAQKRTTSSPPVRGFETADEDMMHRATSSPPCEVKMSRDEEREDMVRDQHHRHIEVVSRTSAQSTSLYAVVAHPPTDDRNIEPTLQQDGPQVYETGASTLSLLTCAADHHMGMLRPSDHSGVPHMAETDLEGPLVVAPQLHHASLQDPLQTHQEQEYMLGQNSVMAEPVSSINYSTPRNTEGRVIEKIRQAPSSPTQRKTRNLILPNSGWF